MNPSDVANKVFITIDVAGWSPARGVFQISWYSGTGPLAAAGQVFDFAVRQLTEAEMLAIAAGNYEVKVADPRGALARCKRYHAQKQQADAAREGRMLHDARDRAVSITTDPRSGADPGVADPAVGGSSAPGSRSVDEARAVLGSSGQVRLSSLGGVDIQPASDQRPV